MAGRYVSQPVIKIYPEWCDELLHVALVCEDMLFHVNRPAERLRHVSTLSPTGGDSVVQLLPVLHYHSDHSKN